MAEARQRLGALSFNRNLFRIVALLFLVHIGQSLDSRDYTLHNGLVNGLQKTKELVKHLREVQSGTDFLLILLDEAKYVLNKKQLEVFQQYLQEAVDEAQRQKVEKSSNIDLDTQQFCKMILKFDPYLQEEKKTIFTFSLKKWLIEATEQLFEICRGYLELQKDAFNGKTKETETKLTCTLKYLTFRKDLRLVCEIIPVLLVLCILALYWICSYICSCR